MDQENDPRDEMRPEYDFRGGVRGKYFARYQSEHTRVVVLVDASPFIATTTSSSPDLGGLTWSPTYPTLQPSPTIQVGTLEEATSRQ